MTHRHAHDRDGCTEISATVCLRPTVHGGAPHITDVDGAIAGGPVEHVAGFIVAFDCPVDTHDGFRVEGAVNVDPHFEADRPLWAMTGSLEGGDLTITPSIRTRHDYSHPAFHGFVTAGAWVPA